MPGPPKGDDLTFWTDVLVPFGSAALGGLFALIGARWGARWAARYQDQQATNIARRIRQEERNEGTKERLIVMLGELHSALWDLQHDRFNGARNRIMRVHLQELLEPNDQLHNVRLFDDPNHSASEGNLNDAIGDVEATLTQLKGAEQLLAPQPPGQRKGRLAAIRNWFTGSG